MLVNTDGIIFVKKFFMLKLADRLRGLRGTESQTAFAARFGLKQAIYSHYETGRKKPSLEVLMEMAIALHTTTDYLLGLSDYRPPVTEKDARHLEAYHAADTEDRKAIDKMLR